MSRPWPVSGWLWMAVAILAVGAAGASFLWYRNAIMKASAGIAALRVENDALRAKERNLTQQIQGLRGGTSTSESVEAEKLSEQLRQGKLTIENLKSSEAKTVKDLQFNLTAANRTLTDLKGRIQELESSVARLKEENQSLTAAETDLQEKVANATRVQQAMETELKGKTARLTKLELLNREIQQKQSEGDKLGSQAKQTIDEIEDINRRRDVYLTAILRRYRDITEQYRTMAARLERMSADAVPAGNEVSRIQDAISLTEEDIRQLNALNSRASALRKKLPGN